MSLFEKRAPVTLRTLSDLTDDFDGDDALAGVDVSNESMATLFVIYAPGTGGTAVEVLPEVQYQGSEVWYPAVSVLSAGATASGRVPSDLIAGTYRTEDRRLVHVTVYGATKLRVRCRELGTISAAGQCTVAAVASRVGV